MKLTFLSAEVPLSKTFKRTESGGMEQTSYPNMWRFTSIEEECHSLQDMFVALVAHSAAGNCLLKGNLKHPIREESRAGLMTYDPTEWICLDFDGLAGATVDQALQRLELTGTSYIVQYSASQGIKPGLRAHVFMLLGDSPVDPPRLKLWLKELNFRFLRDSISLSRSKMALRWPLDISVCQNDKLIYIAPPTFDGIDDPFKGRSRIQLVEKKHLELATSFPSLSKYENKHDEETTAILNKLRVAEGLPKKTFSVRYSSVHEGEILSNPDSITITGSKEARGYGYLNLNGGDSWGYYYNLRSPELVHNFKGEPSFELKKADPKFYKAAVIRANELDLADLERSRSVKEKTHEPLYFIINEAESGTIFKVEHDPAEGTFKLLPAPTARHIKHWCMDKNIPEPKLITDWSIRFDPTGNKQIDSERRLLNLFKPTKYWLNSRPGMLFPEPSDQDVEPYMQLILHVCGGDETACTALINWLAYIWQTGKKPKTAWVLHGTFGTGKGRFLKILQHLFGRHCVTIPPEVLSEKYNGMMEAAQILWLDEFTTDSVDNNKVNPKLKNWITEDTIAIRSMYRNAKEVNNYMGIIVAANEYNPIEVHLGDRRWNIAPRQETPLREQEWATFELLDDETGWLYQPENLDRLAAFLSSWTVRRALLALPLNNQAKRDVQNVTQSAPHDVVQWLKAGNLEAFLHHSPSLTKADSKAAIDYWALMEVLVTSESSNQSYRLCLQELQVLFRHLLGWEQSIRKFSKALAKYGLITKQMRVGKKTFVGFEFSFEVDEDIKEMWESLQSE